MIITLEILKIGLDLLFGATFTSEQYSSAENIFKKTVN